MDIFDFQVLHCRSRWKCQVGDRDGHQTARRDCRQARWRDLISSTWKIPSRDLQKHWKDTFQGFEDPLSPASGKNQRHLIWGCSCYLYGWARPRKLELQYSSLCAEFREGKILRQKSLTGSLVGCHRKGEKSGVLPNL